jgi:hypothetical protein
VWRVSTCCRFEQEHKWKSLSAHLTCFRPSGCLFTLGSPRAEGEEGCVADTTELATTSNR